MSAFSASLKPRSSPGNWNCGAPASSFQIGSELLLTKKLKDLFACLHCEHLVLSLLTITNVVLAL